MDVAFPIISTRRAAHRWGPNLDNEIRYRKHDGSIVHIATNETDDFVSAMGVYWLEMVVDESLPANPIPEGFVRLEQP